MGLHAIHEDVRNEVLRDNPNTTVTLDPEGGGDDILIAKIDTPQAKFKIDRDSIISIISGLIPNIAGALSSGNYPQILNILSSNLPIISTALTGMTVAGSISPKFDVRQDAEGEKCYHCTLTHTLEAKRQPVSLFGFVLAPGGRMEFLNEDKGIVSTPMPANEPVWTLTSTSEIIVKSAQKTIPYFSTALFGTTLKSIPTNGMTNILRALALLLFSDLAAELTVKNTTITIETVTDKECARKSKELSLLASPEEKKMDLAVATLATIDELQKTTANLSNNALKYLISLEHPIVSSQVMEVASSVPQPIESYATKTAEENELESSDHDSPVGKTPSKTQ